MSLSADLTDFISAHRGHGALEAPTGKATANGYRLAVACVCGVTFHRWITPQEVSGGLGDVSAATDMSHRQLPSRPITEIRCFDWSPKVTSLASRSLLSALAVSFCPATGDIRQDS